MAAQSLERTRTALGAFYRRMKIRLGAPAALTATAHKLARLIYFLIKHGQDSVIAKLDLGSMPDLIKVLSGRTETVAELHALIERVGDDPKVWLPIFMGRAPS